MDSKIVAGAVIGAVVIGSGSFYAGMQYAGSSSPQRGQGQFFTGGGGGQRAARAGGGTGGANGGFVGGKVVAMDPSSITIELGGPSASSTNGTATGSKIVLYNGSTQVGKFSVGTPSDLKVGDMVTVQGSTNSDGSITAEMIQVRPAGTGGFGGRGGGGGQ